MPSKRVVMTNLRHLTDDELLQELGPVRHQSPVISELCVRLEAATKSPDLFTLSCPVCRANLDAEYDDVFGTLTLKSKP